MHFSTVGNIYYNEVITMISREELEKQISSVDRTAVEKKLREMGYGDIATKLTQTSNEEILKMLAKNPDIIKRINQMMGGK